MPRAPRLRQILTDPARTFDQDLSDDAEQGSSWIVIRHNVRFETPFF